MYNLFSFLSVMVKHTLYVIITLNLAPLVIMWKFKVLSCKLNKRPVFLQGIVIITLNLAHPCITRAENPPPNKANTNIGLQSLVFFSFD